MRKHLLPLLAAGCLAPMGFAQQFTYTAAALPAQTVWTDGVAVVDVDNDTDLDLLFANGSVYGGAGAAGAQPQHLFLNNGAGTFVAAHAQLNVANFNAKMVIAEDFDGDGHPDLMYASGSDGSPPRLLLNNGLGVFTDVTAANMPALALKSFCVCAGDTDNDGDLDVVVTDGGTFGGTASQARLLQNNGAGVFTDVTGVKLPVDLFNAQDVTLFDYDGDYDIDIALSGKGSTTKRARLYLNNGVGSFTISTILDQLGSGNTYEIDYGDLDGDNDLDSLVQSISGTSEGWGRNDGPLTVQPEFTFASPNGDDDNEMAGFDYDNDGDLDVFVASLGSSEKIYRNTALVFSKQAASIQAQSDSTLDFGFGDLNGDGDYDLITGQGESGNFTNKVYTNAGPADTLAPHFLRASTPNVIGLVSTLFFAQIQDAIQDDGKAWGTMAYDYTVFTATGLSSGSGQAFHMGGGQFRAAIATDANTTGVSLTWTATDPAGNSANNGPINLGNTNPWIDLGLALAGTNGNAVLVGTGPVSPGSLLTLTLSNGLAGSVGLVVASGTRVDLPIFGGILVPNADVLLPFAINGSGVSVTNVGWPLTFPDGTTIYFQNWFVDGGAVQGFAASNAVSATQP